MLRLFFKSSSLIELRSVRDLTRLFRTTFLTGLFSVTCLFAVPLTVSAQQPLEVFLEASEDYAADMEELRALRDQARSTADEARGRFLPSLSAQAGYTRNEFEVAVQIPGSPTRSVISPYDQLDARATLTIPLLHVEAWMAFAQADAAGNAADARLALTREQIRISVIQLWHQLVANRGLVAAAAESVAVATEAQRSARARVEVGLGAQVELARADAELARAIQTQTEVALQGLLAARGLEALSGIEPSGEAAVNAAPSLDAPAPLDTWLEDVQSLPQVRAARSEVASAERGVEGAWLGFIPVVSATASERATNAAGFGPSTAWSIGLSAQWNLDFIRPASIGTRGAGLSAARARLHRAERSAETNIIEAWHRVNAAIQTLRAAQAGFEATARAATDARARYESGSGTQLDSIVAERDRFLSEANLIQARVNLEAARLVLRERSGQH